MTKSKFKGALILFSMLVFNLSLLFAQDNLSSAWKQFSSNKLKEAETIFKTCLNDSKNKPEALIGLALIEWQRNNDKKPIEYIQSFYSTHSDPYPYLYALWSTPCISDEKKMGKTEIEFCQKIINDSKANGTMKAMANNKIGSHYRSIGDIIKARENYYKTKVVENWQVVGTFDNISGSGFNKDFGILSNPTSNAVFKNKVDADVKWFNVPSFRNDRWFDFEYIFETSNSIMYAQSFVKSDIDQDVYFRSGCSGSLKIWLNDQLITSEIEERNCDLDIYTYKVHLNNGYNRILIQIGASEINRANFMLRITDENANPIANITSVVDYQNYKKGSETKTESIKLFAENYFENQIKLNPEKLINYILLAETYLRNDKVFEARTTLQDAQKLAPDNTFLHYRLIEAYSRDDDNTNMSTEQKKIQDNDPDSYWGLTYDMNDADKKEDIDEMIKINDKIKSLYGLSKYTDFKDLVFLAKKKKLDDMMAKLQELTKKYPDDFTILSVRYSLLEKQSKDISAANKILKEYLENNYNDDVITTLAENYYKQGKTKEAFALLKERLEKYPYAIGYYSDLSEKYYNLQNYDEALKWQMKRINMSPFLGYPWHKLGMIYSAQNKNEDAMAAYKKAIVLSPTDYEARKQLRLLEGKKDLFENFKKEDIKNLYKNSEDASKYPDDHSLILLNNTQTVIYPEGASEEHYELLVKVFNQNGVNDWKEYRIDYNGHLQRLIIDKAEVLKPNGDKVDAETNDEDVVFTNLQNNDAIHLSYRLENYYYSRMAKYFWDKYYFNLNIPVKNSRYSLIIPSTKDFHYEMNNGKIEPLVKTFEDYKLMEWEMHDLPSIKPESYMPTLSDIGITLELSSFPDWNFISEWYADISSLKAKSDFEVKKVTSELLAGHEKASEYEKAKIFYEYIEKNFTYSNVSFLHSALIPQKASRTIHTKQGDCKDLSTLFMALCREAGINTNLVLVDTRDNGDKHTNLPGLSFNHCIAQLNTNNKNYYIELTSSNTPMGAMDENIIQTNALNIPFQSGKTTGNQLIKLSTANASPNLIIRKSTVKFTNDDMTIERQCTRIGGPTESIRSSYNHKGKTEQEKIMSEYVASEFTNSTVSNLTFSDLDELKDTIVYTYHVDVNKYLSDLSGYKLFKMPWVDKYTSMDFISLKTRKYPFNLWHLSSKTINSETIKVEIPVGKTLIELPKSIKLTCDGAEYILNYKLDKRMLIAERKLIFTKDNLAPEKYDEFKTFLGKVDENDKKQLGFK